MTPRPWVPLLVGSLLGLAAGLFYAWRVSPLRYTDTDPASLRADFRADYLALVASAYASSGDLARAQARLAAVPDPDIPGSLAALAQQRLGAGFPESEAQALAALAGALGEHPAASPTGLTAAPAASASPPPPTRAPTRRPPPTPTRGPTSTPGAPFRLEEQAPICDPDLTAPVIQVEIFDASGRGVAGVAITVVWDTGQDRFYTGLKPELGLGYADFVMTAETRYSVQAAGTQALVTELQAQTCGASDGSSYPGSWRLRFDQPASP
jgi:hypothetical protein